MIEKLSQKRPTLNRKKTHVEDNGETYHERKSVKEVPGVLQNASEYMCV